MNRASHSVKPVSVSYYIRPSAVFSPRSNTICWGQTCAKFVEPIISQYLHAHSIAPAQCKLNTEHFMGGKKEKKKNNRQVISHLQWGSLGLESNLKIKSVFACCIFHLSYCRCLSDVMRLTFTFGTSRRSDVFVLSSMRLFQSSMSMLLSGQRTDRWCGVATAHHWL